MKKTAPCLCVCLSLLLLLSACQPAPSPSATVEPSPSAQTTPGQVASLPASATPAGETSPDQEQESAAPSATNCPVDLSKAAPLLEVLAESLVMDGEEDANFERYPGAALVDRLFARLLRDGEVSDELEDLRLETGGALISQAALQALYAMVFSEGEYAGLPETAGYGSKEGDMVAYAFPDQGDLQFSMQLREWEALSENGYYELSLNLYWAYPEDAQATQGGSVRCWVKTNDESPFGLGLALVDAQISLRPGEDFGSHPARDVEQIMPMLHAVAKACLETGDGFDQTPSDRFAFEAAYVLLNSYGQDFGLSDSGSSVRVSKETMQSAMAALFGPAYQLPSSVPSQLRGRLQASGSGYTLTRSQEETTPVFADYSVSMSATELITISLRTGDKSEENPWQFHGSATIAVNTADNLPYRNRYAQGASFTPYIDRSGQ